MVQAATIIPHRNERPAMTLETADSVLPYAAPQNGQTRAPTRHEAAIDDIVRGRVRHGSMHVIWPNGRKALYDSGVPGPVAIVRMHRFRALSRLTLAGPIGFADAYVDGDWDSPDLAAVAHFAALNAARERANAATAPALRAFHSLRHGLRTNSRGGSRRNIAAHYDLGNDFYRAWLDPTMSYSSGLFLGTANLAEAQRIKYRRMLDLIAIQPGDHILEIGCGWGGFAELAARERGARVTAVTISRAQHDHAAARIASLGLADKVDILLRDYRDIAGRYDAVVSIEMVEAVGERYWPHFFGTVRDALRPGGRAALQAITIAEDRFARYRRTPDFIQARIFPGGMLPTRTALTEQAGRVGLAPLRDDGFGAHYAATLAEWSRRFETAWPEIRALGFDGRFRRLWLFYLAYCEGGFRSGAVDLRQSLFTRS
jgi:cyclopropane-fatty-acyl-phospholipid synthase